MKKWMHQQLWIYFAGIVFVLMIISVLVAGFLLFGLTKAGLWDANHRSPFLSIVFFATFSSVIGAGIAGFVGQRILQPIKRLGNQMRKVALGDFSQRLDENQKIEEVQQLYQNFNTMVEELNSIETLRNDFVSNVSHEFKTPLSTIQGYVQLLQSDTLSDGDRRKFLKRILDSTSQLSHLTENILKINKLENQNNPFDQRTYRLDEQIREVILFLQPEWERKHIEWDIEMDSVKYDGNEELLYQVWLNVLDNAIKYSYDTGKIRVCLKEDQQGVHLFVSDQGIGMTEETKKHSFDKFYQGDTSRKGAGNGLGLALTKQIIEAVHGTICLDTSLDQGTTVFVTLNNEAAKDKE